MNFNEKRREFDPVEEVQAENQAWWTNQTMSYDWKDQIVHDKYTLPWFDEIDRRFVRDLEILGD